MLEKVERDVRAAAGTEPEPGPAELALLLPAAFVIAVCLAWVRFWRVI